MSAEELRASLRRAEAVWEDPIHKDLFRYADDGELLVNLVLDTRHLTTLENSRRKNDIRSAGDSAAELDEQHRAASARYDAARKGYLAAQVAYEERLATHNRQVETWNARGSVTPSQEEALRKEATSLESARAALEKQRLAVNSLAARANSLSERYADVVKEVNANVDAVNSSAGREFKQGLYVNDGDGPRIDVFTFEGEDDLVHILAHEFGHVLGLVHDEATDSIMYGLNSSATVALTENDLAALKDRCGL